MNNQRVLRLGMGWIRLGLLMIGLFMGLGGDLLAQGTAQTIRGKVLDESGDPLPMASVLVVGTKVGVTTNSKGDVHHQGPRWQEPAPHSLRELQEPDCRS